MNIKKIIISLVVVIGLMGCENMNTSKEKISLGSGYKNLEGSVINYGYEDFDDFNLTINNNKLVWEGQKAYFKGIVFETTPTISRIDKNIYFLSWTTGNHGGDNVVYNLNTMKVNSHLNPNDFDPDVMMMVHGNIYKLNNDAKAPSKKITPLEDIHNILSKNMEEKNLPKLFNIKKNKTLRFEEDKIARKELNGIKIKYKTKNENISLEVLGDKTLVSINNQESESFQTYATKIDKGIYFISWKNDFGGNHILVNTNTNKIFDHLSSKGERGEKIYTLEYFKK